jgi:hypothetical protein
MEYARRPEEFIERIAGFGETLILSSISRRDKEVNGPASGQVGLPILRSRNWKHYFSGRDYDGRFLENGDGRKYIV